MFAENDRSGRKRIVTEICESESVYLASLTTLHTHFYTPLSASCSSIGLSERDVARIFGNLRALISLSTEIRSVLQSGVDAWPVIQRVGALFVRLAPTLKIFAQVRIT